MNIVFTSHKLSILMVWLTCWVSLFSACQSTQKLATNEKPAIADALASNCSADGRGSWNGSQCICNNGWTVDNSGRCIVNSAASSDRGCTQTGGTMYGSTCECPTNSNWSSANNACVASTTYSSARITQAKCEALTTGAVWNGTACLCQNSSYPYWDVLNQKCVSSTQPTTSIVRSVTLAQCTASSASGAYWNGQACQCTSVSYPYWEGSSKTCKYSATATTSTTGTAQGNCSQNQINLNGQCIAVANITETAGCTKSGGQAIIFVGCICPVGTIWYGPLKTCQNTFDINNYAARLCALTGGEATDDTQCSCYDANERVDSRTGRGYCGQ